jgi:hypothetical protein
MASGEFRGADTLVGGRVKEGRGEGLVGRIRMQLTRHRPSRSSLAEVNGANSYYKI